MQTAENDAATPPLGDIDTNSGAERQSAEKDAPIAGHYCGQTQPHAAHVWQTPLVYGQATLISTYQCGGCIIPPGLPGEAQ